MKWLKMAFLAVVLGGSAVGDGVAAGRGRSGPMASMAGAVQTMPVQHRHFRRRSSVFIGVPVFFGWDHYWWGADYYDGYPYPYAYRRYVTAPAESVVYVERGDAATPPGREVGYWYHCTAPEGYYPYVKECTGGWRQITPQPPSE